MSLERVPNDSDECVVQDKFEFNIFSPKFSVIILQFQASPREIIYITECLNPFIH